MIIIGICDDEEQYRAQIKLLCSAFFDTQKQEFGFVEFTSGEEVLAYQGDRIHLLFLDIEMPGMGGLEVLSRVRRNERIWRIVFVTSHKELKWETIDLKTLAFLEKPLEKAGVDVNRKVILDPGYGFGKTVEQNYTVLANQSRLCEFGLPVLSALSRKSMAWKLLKITPDDALPATIALNTVAIEQGAEWIRVHDVQEAVHTNLIVQALRDNK